MHHESNSGTVDPRVANKRWSHAPTPLQIAKEIEALQSMLYRLYGSWPHSTDFLGLLLSWSTYNSSLFLYSRIRIANQLH